MLPSNAPHSPAASESGVDLRVRRLGSGQAKPGTGGRGTEARILGIEGETQVEHEALALSFDLDARPTDLACATVDAILMRGPSLRRSYPSCAAIMSIDPARAIDLEVFSKQARCE
jgi:hypothetical protein